MGKIENSEICRVPYSAIFLFAITVYSFFAVVVAWGGYWFLNGLWPGELKMGLCNIAGISAVILHVLWRILGGKYTPKEKNVHYVMDRIQTLLIIFLVILGGVLFTLLISTPPFVE